MPRNKYTSYEGDLEDDTLNEDALLNALAEHQAQQEYERVMSQRQSTNVPFQGPPIQKSVGTGDKIEFQGPPIQGSVNAESQGPHISGSIPFVSPSLTNAAMSGKDISPVVKVLRGKDEWEELVKKGVRPESEEVVSKRPVDELDIFHPDEPNRKIITRNYEGIPVEGKPPVSIVTGADDEGGSGVFGPGQGRSGNPLSGLKMTAPNFGQESVRVPGAEVRHVSPRVENKIIGAQSIEEEAAIEDSIARYQVTLAEKQTADRKAILVKELNDEANKRESRRQEILDGYLKQQERMADDVKNFKVDPDHAYGTGVGGVFSRIFALLGVTLGAYGAGLLGQKNQAAEILEKWIDNDIDAQKAELAKRQNALGEARSLLAQRMAIFGDERTAEAATRADMYAIASAQADSLMADAKGAQEAARLKAVQAQIQKKHGDEINQMFPWQPEHTVSTGMAAKFQKTYEQQLALVMSQARNLRGPDGKNVSPADMQRIAMDNAYSITGVVSPHGVPSAGGGVSELYNFKDEHGGSAARQQALIGQISKLRSAIPMIDDEIKRTKKGFNFSLEEGAKSKINIASIVDVASVALSGTSAESKISLFKENLPDDVGTFGAWAPDRRVAAWTELKKILSDAEKDLWRTKKSMERSNMDSGSDDDGGVEERKEPLNKSSFSTGKELSED